ILHTTIPMDAYIASLEPDWTSTTTWMRTRAPLAETQSNLKSLGELLGDRLEYLNWAEPGEEADGLRKEVGEVYGKIGEWLVKMDKIG
ncbi:MAG: hypothetical protein Q9169_007605, partial [Polycauliona sp. 2 TL-2023]